MKTKQAQHNANLAAAAAATTTTTTAAPPAAVPAAVLAAPPNSVVWKESEVQLLASAIRVHGFEAKDMLCATFAGVHTREEVLAKVEEGRREGRW